MNQEEEAIPFKASGLETYRAPDMVNLYTTSTRVWASPFEFLLAFGQLDAGITPDKPARTREVATVSMSPQHAKAVLILLAGRMRAWEKQYGEIPPAQVGLTEIPPDVIPQVEEIEDSEP
jgi:hypothetical protein